MSAAMWLLALTIFLIVLGGLLVLIALRREAGRQLPSWRPTVRGERPEGPPPSPRKR